MSRHGANRDPIYAPDGRTWYDLLLDEAQKRGKFQDALCVIAQQQLTTEMGEDVRDNADIEGGYDAIITDARNALHPKPPQTK